MPIPDFARHRLFLEPALADGARLPLEREQANYLLSVLRMKQDDTVLVFNGRDGEWLAAISVEGRKQASLTLVRQTRPQPAAPDLHYLFAPLKHARLDYMAQKAVEMGAGVIQPVLTRRTQVSRLNLDRMRANAVEAAEQCGILSLPEIRAERPLEAALEALEPERLLVFCDEAMAQASPVAALAQAQPGPLAVLIGPEGGFDEGERQRILARPGTLPISLGPRILRADTAAVAALALVQAIRGDWPR
ncbi:MAG: 16S rRNA (uracil(1498)-N(3))-methyltransferase [Bosea sp. (in: a-proteobacteria)]|uniref:16S rRNA (uracil(1498)-N(3))-methyltransferase n=1 Tax=Bosea sp. (in: a-proteobacteria) TaxID=1871050 RepID=UPI001DE70CE8|nr:16S rRNA (uracil(1498)-N(3))-methyltransferase [Bosea sp. (in: a-proteobacteria)]MBA4269045.1 16S rRNA (uracil(1498)-N(3))-methyltransferase [Methylobacterium sp.]MDP3600620.1 16S rRNA (uracil(1498)-N(3))-methyltransferase [Bosea sp. (in: a-proteobacteria)]WRH57895.1 MAG: 16S rRNA (uracil(1498)-N(3))-methyltransferase [Bosea sp. (in: a-proteobacteria)]